MLSLALVFPPEIHYCILEQLPYSEVQKCRQVCQVYRSLIDSDSFWRAKIWRDYPNPAYPPLMSSRPRDVYLEFLSRHDVTVGSEKFKSWQLCFYRAVKKGHLKLVRYFWAFNQPYLVDFMNVDLPCLDIEKALNQAAKSGGYDVFRFIWNCVKIVAPAQVSRLIRSAIIGGNSDIIALIETKFHSFVRAREYGRALGIAFLDDPSRFPEIPAHVWMRDRFEIIHHTLYRGKTKIYKYLRETINYREPLNAVEYLSYTGEAGIQEYEADPASHSILFQVMARQGRVEVIQRLVESHKINDLIDGFNIALEAKQYRVVKYLLPQVLRELTIPQFSLLIRANFIDLAYTCLESPLIRWVFFNQMMRDLTFMRWLVVTCNHKDFANYLIGTYNIPVSELRQTQLFEHTGICLRPWTKTSQGWMQQRYAKIIGPWDNSMILFNRYVGPPNELWHFYRDQSEIPYDVSFSVSPPETISVVEILRHVKSRNSKLYLRLRRHFKEGTRIMRRRR
jgi:hypothetical protein